MFIKNDPEKKFVNGTIGKVVKLENSKVTILIEEFGQKREVEVEAMDWEIQKYKLDPNDPNKI